MERRIALVTLAAALIIAPPASAFDSKGHVVIEALAYRSLAEGRDGEPARPDVLRDLINDGALEPPWCFGRQDAPPRECADPAGSNPLLLWPQPRTDRPDAFFRRQFTDAGQCFHYMAELTDGLSEPLPGTSVPRALATSAIVRCNDLLNAFLRQIVVDGGPGTRRSGYGLYEMMHAVEDSFSGSHAQRTPSGIDYLRVWQPIEKIARIPSERSARIPTDAFHKWDDHRDKTYVIEGGDAHCEKRTDHPYDVPYECLSEEGDRARQAVVDLLVVVRDLRVIELAAPPGSDAAPERSEAWRAYKAKWFTPVHPCGGEECAVRQPPDTSPGKYAFVGLDTSYNPTRGFLDVAARGTVMRFSEELNPFVYALSAKLGYRHFNGGGGTGLAGLGFDFALPVGLRAAVGFTPAELRILFGGDSSGSEIVTRLLRFDYALTDRLALSVEGPLEVNWRKPRAEWTVALGINYGLTARRMTDSQTLLHHQEKALRRDEEWVPPSAPYGRLQGRTSAWYVVTGISVASPPENAVEGRNYGLGLIGGEVTWDRDRWGGRFAVAPAVSLALATRSTTGDSLYLTGVLGAGFRWYFVRGLGLSVTPVRLEGGPKVRAKTEIDTSAGVHGSPGSEYYFRAGSRLGVALNLGIFDILVEGPTIAWASDPFAAHEILSFRLGIRVD